MKVKQLSIDGRPYAKPVSLIEFQSLPSFEAASPETDALKPILEAMATGTIANYAWQGFQVSNTLTHEQLVTHLLGYGVSPTHAPGLADVALEIIRAEPTKVLLVAVSVGSGTWMLMEGSKKVFGWQWSFGQTLGVSLSAATLGAGFYLILRWLGILGQATNAT